MAISHVPEFAGEPHGGYDGLVTAHDGDSRLPSLAAPELTTRMVANASLVFVLIGCFYGATGVGGGILGILALTSLPGFEMSQLQATAYTMGACIPSGGLAFIFWYKEGCVDTLSAACVTVFALAGTAVGARIAGRLPDPILKVMFAFILCFVLSPVSAYRVLNCAYKAMSSSFIELAAMTLEEENTPPSPPMSTCGATNQEPFLDRLRAEPFVAMCHCLVGVIVGFAKGAVGIGDTPLLIAYFVSMGMAQKEAVGTALATTLPTGALVYGTYLARGSVNMLVAPILALAMAVGSGIGARYSSAALSDWQMQGAFSIFVFASGYSTGRSAVHTLRSAKRRWPQVPRRQFVHCFPVPRLRVSFLVE